MPEETLDALNASPRPVPTIRACERPRSGRHRIGLFQAVSCHCRDPGRRADLLPPGRGSQSRPIKAAAGGRMQGIFRSADIIACMGCVAIRRRTSPVPTSARQSPHVYPFRTRDAVAARQCRQRYMPICRDFMSKPSDGLEPSTPSLPWRLEPSAAGRRSRASRLVFRGLVRLSALSADYLEVP